jgi:hypothetical protein
VETQRGSGEVEKETEHQEWKKMGGSVQKPGGSERWRRFAVSQCYPVYYPLTLYITAYCFFLRLSLFPFL